MHFLFLTTSTITIDLMYEELFTKVNKLTMNDPSINLMEEDSMTAEKDLAEHVLDHWVTCSTPLLDRIKKLTPLKAMLLNFLHKRNQRWEHLLINTEFLLHLGYC